MIFTKLNYIYKRIMDSYSESYYCKIYVEHRSTKKTMKHSTTPFYYNFTDLENGRAALNLIKEACASKSEFIFCIISTECHFVKCNIDFPRCLIMAKISF